jgi:ATP-binding cassette subfamily C protein CydC
MMAGAAELRAYGAVDPALASVTADDEDLTRQENRNAAVSGLGTGLGSAIAGQRQRLALARALLADPAVLILDEPTAHLDPDNRRMLTRDLLAATAGRTALLITHDVEGLDQVDEIIVLRQGKVVQRGSYAECRHSALSDRW